MGLHDRPDGPGGSAAGPGGDPTPPPIGSGPVVVIVVPGMPGSELDFVTNGEERGPTVFSLRPSWLIGSLMRSRAIGEALRNPDQAARYRGMIGRIVAARLVPARPGLPSGLRRLLPRTIGEDFGTFLGYEPLISALRAIPGMSAPDRVIGWPYDWRRSVTTNAASLVAVLERVFRRFQLAVPRIVLIGHSTGGLVCAQAITTLSRTSRDHVMLITVATPWHGTHKAARMLVNGPGAGPHLRDAVRSMPGVRETISTAPGTYAPEPRAPLRSSRIVADAAAPGTDAKFAEIESGAVTGMLGCPHHAVVGRSRATPSAAAPGRFRAHRLRVAATADGDGVVTFESATRGQGETTTFVDGDHDNLPAHPAVIAHVVGLVAALATGDPS